MDHARRGEAALAAKNNAEAVTHYTSALAASPAAVPYYIKRSTAYQRCQKYPEALEDANVAVTLAFKRARRELIAQAQLRRGIALFNLQRYGDANACFGWAKKFDEKEKLVGIWEGQVNGKLRGLAEDDEKRAVSIEENPNTDAPAAATAKSPPASSSTAVASVPAASNGGDTKVNKPANGSAGPTAAPQAAPPAQTLASKIRHEWYQNTDNVFITLLAKGVPKDQATIDIGEQSVSVSFPLVTGSSYDFSLEPLYAPVVTTASSFKVLSTKIEITLKKLNTGQKWPALEDDSTMGSATAAPAADASQPAALSGSSTSTKTKSTPPSYPTSSRTGPKNWDRIVSSYAKPAASSDGKSMSKDSADSSKPDDGIYVDEFDDDGDEVNSFFKKLYAGASDETKRAMMKSYQESGGTALSTNWEEVKKAPVPVSPPDGMEEKQWER